MESDPYASDAPIRVGSVGGGLARLAAASVLTEHGTSVDVFEARRQLLSLLSFFISILILPLWLGVFV